MNSKTKNNIIKEINKITYKLNNIEDLVLSLPGENKKIIEPLTLNRAGILSYNRHNISNIKWIKSLRNPYY
tara:strand:- start:132 stop:344 length:213 start_codon:yes stop_codon:yes gene_type:complete